MPDEDAVASDEDAEAANECTSPGCESATWSLDSRVGMEKKGEESDHENPDER
jgi:hypothetical protein